MGVDPGDGLREADDRVLVVGDRAVTGAAVRGQAQPEDALLGGLEEIGTTLPTARAQGDAVSADLADRLGHAVEDLGVMRYDPVRALDATGLLVGEEADDEIARRCRSGAREFADGREDHRVHPLHVDRSAAPDHPVAQLAGEGIDAPVTGVRGDHVEVPVDAQRGAGPVGPGNAGEDIGATGLGLHDDRLQADLAQLRHHVVGRVRLTRPAAVAVVARVDPDQLLADPGDLRLGVCHSRAQEQTFWSFSEYVIITSVYFCDRSAAVDPLLPISPLAAFMVAV